MGANIGTSVTNTIVSMGQMADMSQYQRAFAGATVHDCFNLLSVMLFLPLECATHMIFEFTSVLTAPLENEDGGTFKSPIKIIVSPLVKKIIVVDKKKIKKIANGDLQADDAGSLVKGGAFASMSDDAAGGIALTLSLLILCICLYGIVWTLQKLVMGKARHAIRESLKWSSTEWGGYL